MVEADQARPGGDGTYNAPTSGETKADYVFFTARRWAADYSSTSNDSWLSDHNVLRGEGTLNW